MKDKIKKMLGSRKGIIMLSIILGLGLSCIFKMSCDNRSCIVYKAPDYSEKKIVKYNNKCYKPTENMETCNKEKEIIDI